MCAAVIEINLHNITMYQKERLFLFNFIVQIFFFNLPRRKVMIYFCKKGKKMGVTDFVLERTCPEKYPKSEKSGFFSHSVCKPQNIAIRSLKWNVLCQILFKWTY